jgi:hypothetical protein
VQRAAKRNVSIALSAHKLAMPLKVLKLQAFATIKLTNREKLVMDVQINIWAVLLATLSSMVVGTIWYAQAVFGKAWIKLAKIDTSKNRGSVLKPILITVVVSFITAYVLAHVSYLSNQFFNHSFLQDAVDTAFWLWLGFTATRFITHDAFEGRPTTLTLMTCAHEFVTIMIMGLIIGVMGVGQ